LIDVETRLYGPAAPFPLADAPDSAVPRKQVTQDEPAPSEEPSPGEQFLAARPRRGVLTDDKTKKSKKKS
jgi:hypothetical protein